MKHILVINNADLWISLNREFASHDDLRISESATWDAGIRLAKVESLELIVCSCDPSRSTVEDIASDLVSSGIDLGRVICVVGQESPRIGRGNSPSRLATCLPEQLVGTVRAIVTPPDPSLGPVEIDLLAQCVFEGSQPGEVNRGFVILLKIDTKSLQFESSGPLQIGDVVSMNFVLPRSSSQHAQHERIRIALQCTVRTCLNLEKFNYRGEITHMEREHADGLNQFLAARISKLEN